MTFLRMRFRVLDGVIVAAGALLVLKLVTVFAGPSTSDRGQDGLPSFARVLAHARSDPRLPDPEVTGSVPAKDTKAVAAPEPPAATPSAPSAGAAPAKDSPSERAIRERLTERREELQRRGQEIETREKLVEEAERRAEAKAQETRLAEERQAGGKTAGREAAEGMRGLVVMYETMKPKDAARVFDRLPEDVLVQVVRQIAPRKMAEIMAAMSPDSAQKLTIALARPTAATGSEPMAGGSLPAGELPALEPPLRPQARAVN